MEGTLVKISSEDYSSAKKRPKLYFLKRFAEGEEVVRKSGPKEWDLDAFFKAVKELRKQGPIFDEELLRDEERRESQRYS